MPLVVLALMFGLAVALGACDSKPKCLVDAKDTAVIIEVDQTCVPGRYNCNNYDRLRMQRDSDGTVCAMYSADWKYKAGDKIRGPM